MLPVTLCLCSSSSSQTPQRWLVSLSRVCQALSTPSRFPLEGARRPSLTCRDSQAGRAGPVTLLHVPPHLCTVLAFADGATVSAALCVSCGKSRVSSFL